LSVPLLVFNQQPSVRGIHFRARANQIFPVVSARLNNNPSLVTDNPTFPGLPRLVNDCCE
jgi:hypothetical protein